MSIQNFLANNDNLLVRDRNEHEDSASEERKGSFFFSKDPKKRNKDRDVDRSDLLYVSSKGYFFQ